jgi:predicted transcriptional regulator
MRDIAAELIKEGAEEKQKEILKELVSIYNSTGKVDISDVLKACGISQKMFDDILKKINSKSPKDK